MAHSSTALSAATRIFNLDLIYEHDATGGQVSPAGTIAIGDKRYIAVRDAKDHGRFHLRWVKLRLGGNYRPAHTEPHGWLYQPIDPSMTADDIEGSTYALDKDGKWLFAHCSPEEQVDFAADVQTFCVDQFATAIARANLKVHEATNTRVKAVAFAKLAALVSFAEAVGAEAHKSVVTATLGFFHKDPHQDHRRDLAVASIDAVLAAWAVAGETDKAIRLDRSNVNSTALAIRGVLQASHSIEWRHVRGARLKAEAAAENTDPPTEQG